MLLLLCTPIFHFSHLRFCIHRSILSTFCCGVLKRIIRILHLIKSSKHENYNLYYSLHIFHVLLNMKNIRTVFLLLCFYFRCKNKNIALLLQHSKIWIITIRKNQLYCFINLEQPIVYLKKKTFQRGNTQDLLRECA